MKTCLTCAFARWVMTKHTTPRINTHENGLCAYQVDIETLPIPDARKNNAIRSAFNSMYLPAISANRPHTTCAVWEEK